MDERADYVEESRFQFDGGGEGDRGGRGGREGGSGSRNWRKASRPASLWLWEPTRASRVECVLSRCGWIDGAVRARRQIIASSTCRVSESGMHRLRFASGMHQIFFRQAGSHGCNFDTFCYPVLTGYRLVAILLTSNY